MRILQVVEASGGGVGRHVLDLSEGLAREGHDVHLLYAPARADAIFRERLAGASYSAAPFPIEHRLDRRDLAAARRLRAYLARHGPFEIVHGHSSKAGGVVRLAGVGLRSRIVYTPNAFAAMAPSRAAVRSWVLRRLEQTLALMTDAIICVSPEELEFARSLGIAPHRLHLVPNTAGSLALPSRAAARAAVGLAEEDPVVGFVGRFCFQKAPEVLLAAFAELRRTWPGAVLVLVGDGELADELRRLSAALRLDGAVRWLGPRDGRTVLPAFDLLALPSRYEGLPYVALEALEAGLPIVATTRAGCRLLVREGVNGRLVPPDDAPALARAIGEVLASPELRARWGAASVARSRELNGTPMVAGTLKVYTG